MSYESHRRIETLYNIHIHSSTLVSWANNGQIECIRMPGGKRLYCCEQFEELMSGLSTTTSAAKRRIIQQQRRCIIYARVSSHHQKADLERQINDLQQAHPNHVVVKDIASGLNWKRPGLLSILEQCKRGAVEEVVVAYKDRLCRFGLELLEWIFKEHDVRLCIQNKMDKISSNTNELAEDLLAVTNYFVAKNNGQRAAEKKRKRCEAQQREDSVCSEIQGEPIQLGTVSRATP